MSDIETRQLEDELDSLLRGIRERSRKARRQARILLVIPIVLAVALFTVISRAAARYQQKVIALEKDLSSLRHQETRVSAPSRRDGEGTEDTLARLENDLSRISGSLDSSISNAASLQARLMPGNQSLAATLKTLEMTHVGFTYTTTEGVLTQADEKSLEDFYDLVTGRKTLPPSSLSAEVMKHIALEIESDRRYTLQNTRGAQRLQRANAELARQLGVTVARSREQQTELVATSKKLIEYCRQPK